MKIFIDSADLAEIKEAVALGFVEGCTTNPSLLAKAGRKIETAIPEICEMVAGPVSAEVVATEFAAMLAEARSLAKLHARVVVKVPMTLDGLRAVRTLAKEGVRTNVTLCFSAIQATLAAKAGAAYVSPFVGRLDDVGHDGVELLQQILTVYRNYDHATEVLTASVRGPMQVLQAALAGSHCATVPIGVLRQLVKHPLTDAGLAKFLEDHAEGQRAAR